MSGQTTIKVRKKTREILEKLAEKYGQPIAQIVDSAAQQALKSAQKGHDLKISSAKKVEAAIQKVAESTPEKYGEKK